MKILKVLFVAIISLFFISAQTFGCGKLKLVSATVQKTIPGYIGADIEESFAVSGGVELPTSVPEIGSRFRV